MQFTRLIYPKLFPKKNIIRLKVIIEWCQMLQFETPVERVVKCSCLFRSSISSAQSAITAIVWQDILLSSTKDMSDFKRTFFMKITGNSFHKLISRSVTVTPTVSKANWMPSYRDSLWTYCSRDLRRLGSWSSVPCEEHRRFPGRGQFSNGHASVLKTPLGFKHLL